jgi:hypothetical protein
MLRFIGGFAILHTKHGYNDIAERMLRQALENSDKWHIVDHPDTLYIMRKLGSVYEA